MEGFIMKQKILAIVTVVLLATTCFAQQYGSDCLGVLCTIDVDLSQQKGSPDLVYTIFVPSEGIYLTKSNYFNSRGPIIQGPGAPYLFNYLGNTVDIHLKRAQMIVEYETEPTERFLELFVDKQVTDFGITTTYGNQCYYLIRLLITKKSL